VTPSRRNIIIISLFIILIALGLYWNNQRRNINNFEKGTTVGNSPIDYDFQDVDGEDFSFSDYHGSFLVIDFMAPWCEPCKDQIQILREIDEIPDVEIVSINIDPRYDISYLKNFKSEHKIDWNFAHSPEAGLEYEVSAIPSILLVDKEGKIVYRSFFTPRVHFEQLFEKYG
jgi:thiol-disulfide isomerase/thioredoxin